MRSGNRVRDSGRIRWKGHSYVMREQLAAAVSSRRTNRSKKYLCSKLVINSSDEIYP